MDKILFIGGGQMTEAIIRPLIAKKIYSANNIFVNDINDSRLHYLQNMYNIKPTKQIKANADIIVLGVRPQDQWAQVIKKLKPENKNTIIISIIAGVTISQIKQSLTVDIPVIRAIPNTLTDTEFGYSGVATNTQDQSVVKKYLVIKFFSSFGKLELLDESLLDIFTGYAVAGPNYIYYFYESIVDAGVLAGLHRDLAKRIAIENLYGAAEMLRLSKKHPRELLDINNSPAGVGINGLYELNNSDFAAALQRSVQTAVKRTIELGQINKHKPPMPTQKPTNE
ncbi:pyrroline-5-carboxylate reductase [Gilliamella sp. Gris1-4]|uniref:pyrroline-5-carboxylate reductase n=1 Tax=Gilliamella sp. Gris1-4 TaxID=3120244 RepID=UPI00080DE81D|nr:pyrroline-5-carboxylate reductase [Gilliamella apicola]OCG37584.1 pyrroline-5-carboxylate reductase [Gilliamella apicola]OCG64868.1 pyrroline-5-carboxylate reductase [Gilliamella apicola]